MLACAFIQGNTIFHKYTYIDVMRIGFPLIFNAGNIIYDTDSFCCCCGCIIVPFFVLSCSESGSIDWINGNEINDLYII